MDEEIIIVQRAAAGERDAFAVLYDRYSRPVFLTLVGLLRARDDAEDALQAAFLSAWERLPSLRAPDRFVSWLFRIARNKARDLIRRRRERLLGEVPAEDLMSPAAGVDSAEAVEALLSSLEPRARSLVLLRAVQGWSAEDTAKALGVSPATVRRRYARALEHLGRRLGGGDHED